MARNFVFLFALVLVTVFIGTFPSYADDLTPPTWRGDPGSTVQEWDFLTNGTGPTPDPPFEYWEYTPDGTEVTYDNPYGGALARYYPGTGQDWQSELNGRLGVLPLSGAIYLDIWNTPELDPLKMIKLQVTWQPQAPSEVPIINFEHFEPGSEPFEGQVADQSTMPLENGWQHTWFDLIITPNPFFETIRIGGAIDVDQVVVDTICVPEPGSITLLLCGLISLICLRRRK